MVGANVAQLLLAPHGTVRVLEFSEPLPDPSNDLHLRGPVEGEARLTRTSRGILAHAEYSVAVRLECARCLDPADEIVEGELDEEFLPSTDVRTGLPVEVPRDADEPIIDEHHEIDLDETLRQDILTNLPLHPLCEPNCPGLCPSCGRRLDASHTPHREPAEAEAVNTANPFARLAGLFDDDHTNDTT